MHIRLLLFLCFCYSAGFAQKIDSLQLMTDLLILSSDEFEGRKAPSEGWKKANYYIGERFKSIGLGAVTKDYRQKVVITDWDDPAFPEGRVSGETIIGYIQGISDTIIVISAHYDHVGIENNRIYNGADDNASGVAAMLALAAELVKRNNYYSYAFIAFDLEELGLIGSFAFIKNSPLPLSRMKLNVNLDMVAGNPKGVIYASGTRKYPILKTYTNLAWKKNPNVNLRYGFDNPREANDRRHRSDHAVFQLVDIPYLYFGVPEHSRYHTSEDDYEHIPHGQFYRFSQLILDTVIAIDEGRPTIRVVKGRELE